MARPRKFDIDDAIGKAMNVFWEKGYEGASLTDLLAGMNIARGSLYKAFESKKNLFLLALDRYEREHVDPAIDYLRNGEESRRARIDHVFTGPARSVADGDTRGCLLCNSVGGLANPDEEISARVNGMIDRLTEAFALALSGPEETADDMKVATLLRARSLTAAYVGLRVLSRAGETAGMLEKTARSLLKPNTV